MTVAHGPAGSAGSVGQGRGQTGKPGWPGNWMAGGGVLIWIRWDNSGGEAR